MAGTSNDGSHDSRHLTLNPNDIRYTQDFISACFRNRGLAWLTSFKDTPSPVAHAIVAVGKVAEVLTTMPHRHYSSPVLGKVGSRTVYYDVVYVSGERHVSSSPLAPVVVEDMPLTFNVSVSSSNSSLSWVAFERAVMLLEDLLASVHDSYRVFSAMHGLRTPQLAV